MSEQMQTDVKNLCFFVETVLHLNPTRMDSRTVQAYALVVERTRAALEAARGVEVGGA